MDIENTGFSADELSRNPATLKHGTASQRRQRQRQQARPEAVPTDIERQNQASLQRSTDTTREDTPAGETVVPDSVRNVLSSPGQSLDGTIQRTMEDRMGDSFGNVQVHTGPQAAAACEDINARAFTVGNHVAFNRGEYDPDSPDGQHVIAHELTHVRQQNADISMLPQEGLALEIDPDPKLEQEAEETARRVMTGGEVSRQRASAADMHIQRLEPVTLQYLGTLLLDRPTREALLSIGEYKVQETVDLVDETTSRDVRLNNDELEALEEKHIESREDLEEALRDLGVEPTSDLEETVDSPLRWSLSAASGTYSIGGLLSLGVPPAAIAAVLAGIATWKILDEYGDEIGEEAREVIRKLLDLDDGELDLVLTEDEDGETVAESRK